MPVIGNTYVGGNPYDQQFTDTLNQATAQLGPRIQDRREKGYKELDDQVSAIYNKFGPLAFNKQVPDSNKPGEVMDNPYYEQNAILMDKASKSFGIAFHKDPKGYASMYLNKPFDAEQAGQWGFAIGEFIKDRSKGDSSPPPSGDPSRTVGYTPPSEGGGGKVEAIPQPPQPPQQGFVQELDTGVPQGPAPVATAQLGQGLTASGTPAAQKVVPASVGIARMSPEQVLASASDPEAAGFQGALGTTQEDQAKLQLKNAMASLMYTNPQGQIVPKVDRKSLEQMARASQNGLERQAAYELLKQQDGGIVKWQTALAPIKATGTGGAPMSPQELVQHEARTGDIHVPALIGIKEGIVNSNAMSHGGQEAVRRLNQTYPVFADGYDGTGMEPQAGYPEPESVTYGQVQQYEQPLTLDEQTPLTPSRPAEVMPTTMPEERKPLGSPSDLAKEVSFQVGPSPYKVKPDKKKIDLIGLKAKAEALGDKWKANAISTRIIQQEGVATRQAVSDAAYIKHMGKITSGISDFIKTADDTELAYYGFDKVLKARMDAAAVVELGKNNESQRRLMEAQGKNLGKSDEEIKAKIRLLDAQAALYEKQAKDALQSPEQTTIASSIEYVKEMIKLYDDPEKLQEAIAQSPNMQKAFSNFAVWSTGDKTAKWDVLIRDKGFFSGIKNWFVGGNLTGTPSSFGSTMGGAQATVVPKTGKEYDDFMSRYPGLTE